MTQIGLKTNAIPKIPNGVSGTIGIKSPPKSPIFQGTTNYQYHQYQPYNPRSGQSPPKIITNSKSKIRLWFLYLIFHMLKLYKWIKTKKDQNQFHSMSFIKKWFNVDI